MNTKQQHYTDDGSLSASERLQMRNALQSFVDEHPAQIPWRIRALDSVEAWFSARSSSHFSYLRPAAAVLAIVLFAGAGTSYAAENALPGDALYPVKINVNEQIEGALATTPEAKAQWNATRISRRLEEAETLAAQDRLTPAASSIIQSQITDSSEDFNQNVATLAQASTSAPQIVTAQSNLEATLVGNAQVLAALNISVASSSQTQLAPILASVEQKVAHVDRARAIAENAITINAASTTLIAAQTTQTGAAQAISKVRTLSAQAAALGASTSLQVNTATLATEEAVTIGNENLKAGKYGEAFQAFQSAIQAAQETETSVDAQVHLKDTTGISILASTTLPVLTISTSSTSTDATSTLQSSDGSSTEVQATSSDQ